MGVVTGKYVDPPPSGQLQWHRNDAIKRGASFRARVKRAYSESEAADARSADFII